MSQPKSKLSRRTLFAGAGVVGATAVAVSLLPAVREVVQTPDASGDAPVRGGGYRLSEHVKQYYKTTLI